MERRPVRPKSAPPGRLGSQDLDQLTAEILGFLAADPARLAAFLEATGLEPGGIRAAARAPGFAASLLDYIGSDEALLRTFAEAHHYDPAALDALRSNLSGGSTGAA